MSEIINLRYCEKKNTDFIFTLFNSNEFLKNGMRRITEDELSQMYKKDSYYDFDSGNGFLIFYEVATLNEIGAVKISTSLRNQVSTISGGVKNDYFGTLHSSTSLIETMRFLFSNYPIQRIEMNILFSNIRSLRFHEKIGFVKEGVKRNAWFCEGRLQDQVIMGILREEFKKQYAPPPATLGDNNIKELFHQ